MSTIGSTISRRILFARFEKETGIKVHYDTYDNNGGARDKVTDRSYKL